MEVFANKCPFCGEIRFLSQDSFVFNNASYTIIRCVNQNCNKVIVSFKDNTEAELKSFKEQLQRMKELSGIKDNEGI